MANELKDAFESMNLSTEHLEMALEAAKSRDGQQLDDRELAQIEDMLSKLRAMFSETSTKAITQPRAERGDVQAQKVILDQVTSQYQAMNALVSNMTQTLMRLEGVRGKFDQVYGGVNGMLAMAEQAQKAPGAAQLQLKGMFDETKNSLEQYTDAFKTQLNEQMALYEAVGAEYYQMMAAMKFIPNVPHPASDTPADENNGNDGNNADQNGENTGDETNPENAENAENAGTEGNGEAPAADDIPPVTGSDNEMEEFVPPPVTPVVVTSETQEFVPPPVAVAAAPGGEQQAASAAGAPMGGGVAAPAGEQQATVAGGAPMGGGVAAPVGEQQATVAGGVPMGGGVAGAAQAPTGGAGAPESHVQSAPAANSGMAGSHTEQARGLENAEHLDRGRKDERQKKRGRKKA